MISHTLLIVFTIEFGLACLFAFIEANYPLAVYFLGATILNIGLLLFKGGV
jgi:hypothetical protein